MCFSNLENIISERINTESPLGFDDKMAKKDTEDTKVSQGEYFERAIPSSPPAESNYDDSNVVYWEVKFMIGKVRHVYAQI